MCYTQIYEMLVTINSTKYGSMTDTFSSNINRREGDRVSEGEGKLKEVVGCIS